MEKKDTVLISVSYLVELSEEDINTDYGMLDKITNEISENKKLNIDGIDILWNSTSALVLDSKHYNCGKCVKCGQWTTDREKPDTIVGLSNGATINGRLLCDECLPPKHKWAF